MSSGGLYLVYTTRPQCELLVILAQPYLTKEQIRSSVPQATVDAIYALYGPMSSSTLASNRAADRLLDPHHDRNAERVSGCTRHLYSLRLREC